jgi:hypothetical protein
MLRVSKRAIKQGYKGVKRMAQKAFARGDVNQALVHIGQCTVLAQQFNWIYSDDELEDLLESIGNKLIKETSKDYHPVNNRVVFYDAFCKSFVLALQYVEALVAAGKEVMYITTSDDLAENKTGFADILERLGDYSSVKVIIVPPGKDTERIVFFYDAVVDFCPEQILLHMVADAVVLPALFVLPSAIKRYIINLADQTFWLGKKAIDYCIEFRQFGVSVSQQRRGIKPEQQLLVPFYPVDDGNPFDGFPKECSSEKMVVFSGGDLYKVLDEKRMYWRLVKRLLDDYPNVVLLFATKISKGINHVIDGFVKDNGFEGRFVYIRYRKDIYEVFKHCDIYMGTCPASGSLMSQLAAVNAKPILQYYYPGTPDDETEQAICYNDKFSISFQDEELFMEEAHRLITDAEYRKRQGERLRDAMITPKQFNKLVADTLSTNKSQVPLEPFDVNYLLLDDRWYALEKLGYVDAMSYLWGVLGKKYVWRFMPMVTIKKYVSALLK